MPKSHKIPDRWRDYAPCGDVIKGTSIIPFKVPLKRALCSRMSTDESFTPANLLDILKEKNLRLGLVIDLTATTRYYNPQVFQENDVQYVKIFTQGHVVPSDDVIQQFTSAVSDFEQSNDAGTSDYVIGVHCTHGVNRTGYLICRYLIEHKEFEPAKAIEAFAKARGYPIERQNYLDSLLGLTENGETVPTVKSNEEDVDKHVHHHPELQSEQDKRPYSTECRRDHRYNSERDTQRHHNPWHYGADWNPYSDRPQWRGCHDDRFHFNHYDPYGNAGQWDHRWRSSESWESMKARRGQYSGRNGTRKHRGYRSRSPHGNWNWHRGYNNRSNWHHYNDREQRTYNRHIRFDED
ncbi:mRNA-capping enzyme-like [Diadema setosum]|uniref:mRNA-capping enzyme-like n=1 Tax=Diadema setosum TaxID=31175 RepID=UPI003B3BDF16